MLRNPCVVTADVARARFFRLTGGKLEEIGDLVDPARRLRDSEIFSDTRPGLRQAQRGGPRHGVDDRRESHRAAADREFAARVVEEIEARCRELRPDGLVLAAPPRMLGWLRLALEGRPRLQRLVVHVANRDLTRLSPPELQDWLAADGVVPETSAARTLLS